MSPGHSSIKADQAIGRVDLSPTPRKQQAQVGVWVTLKVRDKLMLSIMLLDRS